MCRLGGCLLATKIVIKAATARSPRALATGWGLRPGEGKREVRRSPVRISVPSKKNLPQKIKVHPNYPNTLVALVFMQQMFNFIISYVHVCKYWIRYFQIPMQRTGPIKKKTIHHIQYQSFCFAFEIFHRVLQSLVKARNLATFCQNTTLNDDVMRASCCCTTSKSLTLGDS